MHPREMRAEGGGMVMMCMIRRVDTTNHFVPVVTPSRLVLTRALIQSRLSHRNRYQPNKYFSFAFNVFKGAMHILSAAHEY